MSESLEDDDVIVFVMGDEKKPKDDLQIQVSCPVTIEIESLGDYAEDKSGDEIFKSPVHTKQENTKEEYDVEYLEEDNFKRENEEETEEYAAEYLEDLPIEFEKAELYDNDQDDRDQDYHNQEDSDQDYHNQEESDQDRSDYEIKVTKKKTVRKKTSPKTTQIKTPKKKTDKCVSFVKELRKEHPKLAKDEQLLVEHLAEIMRETRPPDPPLGYCTIIKVQGVQTKYECTFCGAQTDTMPSAALHYQFKHGEYYLKCFACGVTFRNGTSLYKHEKRCRAPDAGVVLRARGHYLGRRGRGRPFTTTNRFITCKKPTPPKNKTKFFCTQCPASFVRRDILKAHEYSHTGARPFRCDRCSMGYTSYPALKRHLLVHGESQYICDHCGRQFKLKPILVRHLETHQSVRKYPCLYCERRFAQKTALQHHMNKLHLNLPAAHGCPVCPKRYARISHVKEHMDKAHGLTMISRKLLYQALPTMSETEVAQAKKYFNEELNESEVEESKEPEHILPDLTDKTLKQTKKTSQQKRYIEIIKKKQPEVDQFPEPDDIVYDNVSADYIVEIETTQTKKEAKAKKKQPENSKPKMKRKLPQRKKIVIPEPSMKIDEEIEDDLCNIEYKRQRKTKNAAPENKKTDEEMDKIVRDIKSTLTNRKKAPADKKNPTQNFYKLKREFMNQLKNEMEIPDTKEEKAENTVVERKSPEHLVPGTEIPENLVPWTSKTGNLMPEKKKDSDDDATDDEWKVYKDATEKNIVISDFLDYVKSGVVPKHVPILRRGEQTQTSKKLKRQT